MMAGGGRENFSISYPDLPWSGEREDPIPHFHISESAVRSGYKIMAFYHVLRFSLNFASTPVWVF